MNEKNIKQVEDYNKKADLLIEEKRMLKELSKNYYLYNSYKEADRIFEELMGEEVDPRKVFIQENAHFADNLDI